MGDTSGKITLDKFEAAELLGVTPGTLRVWVVNRRVPYVKVGSKVRFLRADLIEWLENRRVPEQAQS